MSRQNFADPIGFVNIPGFSKYAISPNGDIFNRSTGHLLTIKPDMFNGYLKVSMKADGSEKIKPYPHHRIVGMTFIPTVGNIAENQINHKNGNKRDNRIENLEWVDGKTNVRHARQMGLTPDRIKISVRNVDSGEVRKYPSIWALKKENETSQSFDLRNISYTALKLRVARGELRVYPERLQYRRGHSDIPWSDEFEFNKFLTQHGTNKAVDIRYILTDEIMSFQKLSDAARHLEISPATLTLRLFRPGQLVYYPGFYQLKLALDTTPWRKTDDPFLEISQSGNIRPIAVTNVVSGETRIYASCVECATDLEVSPTALNFRLKYGFGNEYDGYKFDYYDEYLAGQGRSEL